LTSGLDGGGAEAPPSSPDSRAIGALTFTPSAPSGTSSSSTTPSSTASTSMVALPVSISAITSPGFTVSPVFTCHFACLPSSSVGDRAVMRTSIDMRRSDARLGFDHDGLHPALGAAGEALVDGLAVVVHRIGRAAVEAGQAGPQHVDHAQQPASALADRGD